jgi:glucose-specific phosphotransferase system IIA component
MQKECECIMFGKLKNLFSQPGITIASPVSGTVVPLTEVPDPTFAQGILGPGAAVQPSEGRIVAPANGTVDMMFDTGHAVSMTTSEGAELLIHVGIDTVNLKGQHYTAKCKSGDTVDSQKHFKLLQGARTIPYNIDAIREAGYEVVTPVIVCNPDAFASVKTEDAGSVQAGDDLLTLEKK